MNLLETQMKFRIIFIVLVCLVWDVLPTNACTCDASSYRTILRDASVQYAFAGKIIAATSATTATQRNAVLIIFRVLKVWKGVTTPTVTVLQGIFGTCDRFFPRPGTVGFDSTRIYLFAGGNYQGNISTNICFPSIITDEKGLVGYAQEFDSLAALPPLPSIINDDADFKISVSPTITTASLSGFDINVRYENADISFPMQFLYFGGVSVPLIPVAQIEPWTTSATVVGGRARSNAVIRYRIPPEFSRMIGRFQISASFLLNFMVWADIRPIGMSTSTFIDIIPAPNVVKNGEVLSLKPIPFTPLGASIVSVEQISSSGGALTIEQKSSGTLKMEVYNSKNARVLKIAEGRYALGRHSISFDMAQLENGFYTCCVESSTGTDFRTFEVKK